MLGVTFEGGANRTVFSCGVIDALIRNKIKSDYIIGTSAGIAYGVTYSSGQYGRNYKIVKDYIADKRYQGIRHMFNIKNRSFYNLDFVFDELPNNLVPFNYKAYCGFKGNIIATVTNVETGKPEYLEVPRDDRKFMLLRASCSMPLLFPIVEINGKKYLDGGVSDSIPFRQAMRSGCDKNIVVLTRERTYRKKEESIAKLVEFAYRHYPDFIKTYQKRPYNYNRCIEDLEKLESEGKVFVIAPDTTMNVSRTDSDTRKLKALYKHGYDVAMRSMPKLIEYLRQ
ncbi:MAG: patatin family protein [Oscillospiraceae bacterium]|nr:patatin family protein [Oscillospiraceae bacterium]